MGAEQSGAPGSEPGRRDRGLEAGTPAVRPGSVHITEAHRQGGFNDRNAFPHSSGARGLAPSAAFVLGLKTATVLSPPCVLTWPSLCVCVCVCVLIASSEDTGHTGLRPNVTISFTLITSVKTPVHIRRFWG